MSSAGSERVESAPFLLRLFYRNGSFPKPEEFASRTLPPQISVYTGPNCTLQELALELAASEPSVLPSPSIGTRLAFQLVCPDLRQASTFPHPQSRYAVKDLGSIVIGGEGPGAEDTGDLGMASDDHKTLADARFVVGDFVSCAVLPPMPNGSVAPVSIAKKDLAVGPREGRTGFRSEPYSTNDGFGRNFGRGGRSNWREGGGSSIPAGEWRRGERLPDGGVGRGRPRGGGNW